MLIMLIMLVKKIAQSCRLGNKAEFVHKPIGNMNQSKNLTLLTISRFSGRQLDYIVGFDQQQATYPVGKAARQLPYRLHCQTVPNDIDLSVNRMVLWLGIVCRSLYGDTAYKEALLESPAWARPC